MCYTYQNPIILDLQYNFLLSLPEAEEYVAVGLRIQLGSVEIGRKLNSALEDIVYESDILDNALRINVNDPLGSYNTKTWRCYTSAGTTGMPSGVTVAIRKPVMRYDSNNILLELYESSPTYGRIWINRYSLDDNKWYGWKCISPQ